MHLRYWHSYLPEELLHNTHAFFKAALDGYGMHPLDLNRLHASAHDLFSNKRGRSGTITSELVGIARALLQQLGAKLLGSTGHFN